jgi:hypothetical protein
MFRKFHFIVLGQIDESLYRKRNSVVSLRSSKDSLCAARAQIKLNYDFARCDFTVCLMEGKFTLKIGSSKK